MSRTTRPLPEQIKQDAPLRLSVAASVAFPDGSMTASGLRREGPRSGCRRVGPHLYAEAHAVRRRPLG